MSPEIFDVSGNRLIGEPITRPDGMEVAAWEVRGNKGLLLQIDRFYDCFFERRDVEVYGDGNFDRGVDRIAQAYYRVGAEKIRVGERIWLKDEIERLKQEQQSLDNPS